jgi:hypothetical protein
MFYHLSLSRSQVSPRASELGRISDVRRALELAKARRTVGEGGEATVEAEELSYAADTRRFFLSIADPGL